MKRTQTCWILPTLATTVALLLGQTALGQEPQTFVFAQMANGQGLTSEIILQNYGGIAQKGTISLFKGKGERLDCNSTATTEANLPSTFRRAVSSSWKRVERGISKPVTPLSRSMVRCRSSPGRWFSVWPAARFQFRVPR